MGDIDLDRPCPHDNFDADVDVNRITDGDDGPLTALMADVKVRCANCDETMRFTGMPGGVSFKEPRCSVDEAEARLPIRPASSDPDFGMGLPGFNVRRHDDAS